MDAKKSQFQQIRENEAKREAERETEHFWADISQMEYRAMV